MEPFNERQEFFHRTPRQDRNARVLEWGLIGGTVAMVITHGRHRLVFPEPLTSKRPRGYRGLELVGRRLSAR
jgi:hypothetical protein